MEDKQLENEMLELNEQFSEFLKTKGIIAKFKLVIENIKKGASTQSTKTAEQIAKVKAQTQANIKKANSYSGQNINTSLVTAEMLAEEFNSFLKSKGLDAKYSVIITEEE